MTEMEKSHRRWKGGSRTTIYQMLDRYLRQWHPQNGTAQGRSTISPDRHRWFAIFKPCSSIPVSIAATFVSKCLLVSEPVTGPKKFPFHMWTPDVYERAPAPITAFGATVSKGASHDRRRFYDHAAVAGRDSAYSRVRWQSLHRCRSRLRFAVGVDVYFCRHQRHQPLLLLANHCCTVQPRGTNDCSQGSIKTRGISLVNVDTWRFHSGRDRDRLLSQRRFAADSNMITGTGDRTPCPARAAKQ